MRDLLAAAGATVRELACIVAVNGPGSFTGVRLGLSAVKGLAEPAGTPVVALSRLEVLAWKAGTACAGFGRSSPRDIFAFGCDGGARTGELLAGAAELAAMTPVRLGSPFVTMPPRRCCVPHGPARNCYGWLRPRRRTPSMWRFRRFWRGSSADLMLLDGHYLRRSDAEIFGEPAGRPARGA